MDEIDGEGGFSDRFKAFRRAVHLESPLEFAVVLIVLVCLLGGVGKFLRTPGNWFLLKHGMWGQLLGIRSTAGRWRWCRSVGAPCWFEPCAG